eukprot:1826394-Prorocentrum_lima.AAC.1
MLWQKDWKNRLPVSSSHGWEAVWRYTQSGQHCRRKPPWMPMITRFGGDGTGWWTRPCRTTPGCLPLSPEKWAA